jgi:hypothetical protein
MLFLSRVGLKFARPVSVSSSVNQEIIEESRYKVDGIRGTLSHRAELMAT